MEEETHAVNRVFFHSDLPQFGEKIVVVFLNFFFLFLNFATAFHVGIQLK